MNLNWRILFLKDVDAMSHATADDIRTRQLEQMLRWDPLIPHGLDPSGEGDDAGPDQGA